MTARGESIIEVNGREVFLLYNNLALAKAEKEMGKGVVDVMRNFQSGGSISDLAVLLRHGMEAARRDQRVGGRPISMADAYRLMDEVMFPVVAETVMMAVADVLGYGDDTTDIVTSTEDGEDTSAELSTGPNE